MKKILIVDDEENARLYIAEILHELFPNIEIQLASTPTEAVFLISQKCADIILLDVEMPGMTGLEMLAQLRESIKQTPVIFVSSYKHAEFIQKAIRLNAVDYIDKPVDPCELKRAIEKSNALLYSNDSRKNAQKLMLFTEKGEMFFDANEIMYFESKKRDSIAHFVNGFQEVTVRCNLKELETILPTGVFARASRQCIINLEFIKFTSQSTRSITLMEGCKSILIDRINPDFLKKLK